jgi:electron transfer flavoprotein alpha/beta subunit
MLGRHIYRVHPDDGHWSITKEGETAPRAIVPDQRAAIEEACRLAKLDEPSRVTIDDGDGKILEERLFGADLSQEFDA